MNFAGSCCSHCPWASPILASKALWPHWDLTVLLRNILKNTGATMAHAESRNARTHLVSLAVLSQVEAQRRPETGSAAAVTTRTLAACSTLLNQKAQTQMAPRVTVSKGNSFEPKLDLKLSGP